MTVKMLPSIVLEQGWRGSKVYMGCFKNFPVRLLGTRFTNAITCLEPGPQEPYRDIPLYCRFIDILGRYIFSQMCTQGHEPFKFMTFINVLLSLLMKLVSLVYLHKKRSICYL
jgi:hypothetical protein